MLSKRFFTFLVCFLVFSLNAQTISYSWLDKIGLAKEMLREVKLKHSKQTKTYIQKLKPLKTKRRSKSKQRITIRKNTDYAWKEIALAIMDMDNGNIEIVKVTKKAQELINPNLRYIISLEPRPSGLTWNGKNTAFLVTGEGSTYAVIANKWLERQNDGIAKEKIYTPFSTKLNQEGLIGAGENHLKNDVDLALGQLGLWGVGSLAYPQKTVASIVPPDYLRNIALNEQTDPREFYAFLGNALEYDPFQRVLVLIAANGEEAYSETQSNANALGLTQFTNGAWSLIRKEYLHSELPDFRTGAGDHIKSLQATALLYDYNLAKLINAFGQEILRDENLVFYLAAAHNCGIGRVITALKKPGKDWRKDLRKLGKTNETIIYLEKMDYLMESVN